MAQIRVTPAELRSAATALREQNANFSNQVKQLESSEATLNSQWSGPSHDVFHASFMNDKTYMEKFAAEIEKYCCTLENMAAEYEKAENANIDLIKTKSR